MKWQRKSSKLGEKHIVQGSENPQWPNHQRTPTTKYKETHTKANNEVVRPKGEQSKTNQPNEDYVLKCQHNARRTLVQLLEWATDLHKCRTLTLTLAVLTLSQPTRNGSWHHLILFLFFLSLFFLIFAFWRWFLQLLLVPRPLLDTHSPILWDTLSEQHKCNARNINELVR